MWQPTVNDGDFRRGIKDLYGQPFVHVKSP
jgi:hypothetical protein